MEGDTESKRTGWIDFAYVGEREVWGLGRGEEE
jgi:hypothetical protein